MSVPPSDEIHPFLKGNFAPVTEEYVNHPCEIVSGVVPRELEGGQYIRNGGNPVYPPERGRHYHWFDGDGMLHGVHFPSSGQSGQVDRARNGYSGPGDRGRSAPAPIYTNRHLATPLLDLTLLLLRSPIPSIALLISPLSSLPKILTAIIQAFTIAMRARLGVLSVANTSVIWWAKGLGTEAAEERGIEDVLGIGESGGDGRLLATCESGPPLEVRVPGLETVKWDRLDDGEEHLGNRRGGWEWFQRWGLSRVQEDWMTAHPRVDPVDGSFIFYSTQMFDSPHARYSVIDRYGNHLVWKQGIDTGRAKMMHDFGCTRTHTILLNLPLTLSPRNMFQLKPQPLIHFDRSLPSEFIIFPRLHPDRLIRFTDPEPCLIFHTANSWDDYDHTGQVVAVNMLGCRFKSAKLVYSAGAVDVPKIERQFGENDTVQLYYYRFDLLTGHISHAFPLSTIPFEFPTIPPAFGMQPCQYVYGCTMASGSFDERLGGAAKVDCLVKLDVLELIRRGKKRGEGKWDEAVDTRSASEIIRDGNRRDGGVISVFKCPEGWYAQEPRFVPRENGRGEDDGYLLSYVYDEQYILPDGTPSVAPDSGSELWIIDAKTMNSGHEAVTCRIKLPQRVPYGLHGTWLPPSAFNTQRPLSTPLKNQPLLQDKLARSRIQHFVSIIFSRPPTRDRSLFERIVLGVMWPTAFLLLGVALVEAYRHIIISPHSDLGIEGIEMVEKGTTSVPKGTVLGMSPLMVEVIAVGLITLGWWVWPGDVVEEEEVVME